jgi:phosphopantothenoylcysteine decarboxylase/phosphopantothenate--cysteine ligase
VLVSFAADQGERGLERAREKLTRKRADLVVFNDVARDGIAFDAEDNEVVLITASGERPLAKAPKREIAAAIIDAAEELMEESRAGS